MIRDQREDSAVGISSVGTPKDDGSIIMSAQMR